MTNQIKNISVLALMFFSFVLMAKENINYPGASSISYTRVASGCEPSKSKTDLDVNNVRTTIMGAGDMWWDLADAKYEIPKDGGKHSMFAGALWIGGVDAGGQLKVAAMTYRQDGSDFWTGPIGTITANTDPVTCNAWDKHFKITRAEVEEHVARWDDPTYDMPLSIEKWPAHPNLVENHMLVDADYYIAPFSEHEDSQNGTYNPDEGDYPDYNISGENNNAEVFGDQTLFWVFNDKGNIHTESGAEPLGLEIRAQAFGFTSDDAVNDMTFYNYKIINRSTAPLNNTYFGQWVDPDLGKYDDDFVGCDVDLGLGFCYNGDAEDDGASGYGFNPPAIGVDFFQGPLADPGDGIDNDRDGTFDEPGEQIIMSKFVYYNNDFSVTGNPQSGTHIYNYLRGIWKDNVPMTYGGDGHGGGTGSTNDLCNFMFPGTSDPDFPSQEWTEVTSSNTPADRRFLQSAGPFTLQPGAVNEITTGVVWARAKSGGQTASVVLVKIFDQLAQALFDNNFDILNGPDAPDLEIRELNQELIFTISNGSTSNNQNESYQEKDPFIQNPINIPDNVNYEFQGYLVYQLKNGTVSPTDLDDPDLARLVFRSDIKDGVGSILNQYYDPEMEVWTPVQEVAGTLSEGVLGGVDEGIQNSFQIKDDKFALGSTKLINHKTYYFMTLAYGYNEAEFNVNPYDNTNPNYDGRNRPYIAGRRNIQVYSAIPHYTQPDNGGTILNANYGDGVKLVRKEGQGSGQGDLSLTASTVTEILNSPDHRAFDLKYEAGRGPIDISVVDPLQVQSGDYIFKLTNPELTNQNIIESYNGWSLSDDEGNIIASSDNSISGGDEKYINSLGLNIKVKQSDNPAADPTANEDNGFISGVLSFDNTSKRWLTGVPDRDDESSFFSLWGLNWIRAGSYTNETTTVQSDYNQNDDPNGVYEGVIEQSATVFGFSVKGGTWAPYRFASNFNDGPGFNSTVTNSYVKMDKLNSVDVVFTRNPNHWTQCVVVEAQESTDLAIGGQSKMGIRKSPSLSKKQVADAYNISGVDDESVPDLEGWSWFPGYAIDVETGERLNIIFAEDSWLTDENGADMLWNPTSNMVTSDFPQVDFSSSPPEFSGGNYLLGGKHFIYILRGESWVKNTDEYLDPNLSSSQITSKDKYSPNYDACAWAHRQLKDGGLAGAFNVFKHVTWTTIPALTQGQSLLSTDATVKLRVTKPFRQYESVDASLILDNSYDLTIGETYVVAYKNDATTWGGFTATHPAGTGTVYQPGESFVATTTGFSGNNKARVIAYSSLNAFNPIYSFNTDSIVAVKSDALTAKNALEMINVVPNPYYGKSNYEINQLDNRVKITNLPKMAVISIYTINGILVRTLKKDTEISSIDWDLKNDYGIPIASGLYVIHVKTNEGEKVLKWFGALRPIDLDTF